VSAGVYKWRTYFLVHLLWLLYLVFLSVLILTFYTNILLYIEVH